MTIQRTYLSAKIHRAVVTEARLDYEGSITIDRALLEAAGMREYERLQVVDLENGNRLETYALAAPPRSGTVQINGAAARLISKGDRVIIMAYALVPDPPPEDWQPCVVLVDEANQVREVHHAAVH